MYCSRSFGFLMSPESINNYKFSKSIFHTIIIAHTIVQLIKRHSQKADSTSSPLILPEFIVWDDFFACGCTKPSSSQAQASTQSIGRRNHSESALLQCVA